MNTYTPVLKYPKKYLHLSEEEQSSFDINNKNQVADFIQEAIEKKYRGEQVQPDRDTKFKTGLIMESMLEDNFGENLDGRQYKDFVMDYLLSNFSKTLERHDLMVEALRQWGILKDPSSQRK